jgi:hypothetical protein
MLVAVGRSLAEPQQVIIRCGGIDDQAKELLADEHKQFAPYAGSFALTDDAAQTLRPLSPFLAGLERKGRVTIYRCRNFTCELPVVID